MSEPKVSIPSNAGPIVAPNSEELDALVVRRTDSLFAPDVVTRGDAIRDRVRGRRVLVVGGGGSIGSVTTRLVLGYQPAAVHVVDQSENYLAELVRDLRSGAADIGAADLRMLPVDYGSPVMERLLRESAPYDIVLNFAALKHVRSEKDVYSLLQMLDTNIVRHARFKQWLSAHGHAETYFAVSTDKAANPSSLMGASKRLMEDLVFGSFVAHSKSTTSARFANVAFSNGSILQSFLQRLSRRQPLAVPRDTRRYFVSQREAGDLCILAAFQTPDQHIAFPRMEPETELQDLQAVATRVLNRFGFTPELTEDEAAARRDVGALAREGRWPLLLTPLDTSGEKPYEEFIGKNETAVEIGMNAVRAIGHRSSLAPEQGLFQQLERLINDASTSATKADIVNAIRHAVPNFHHTETGRDLDQRS
jgi:FlaA1/EpsC-like NDP-sugar epimerase